MQNIEELEKLIKYNFRNKDLLNTALTHSSYANDYLGNTDLGNERLEFLGDAMLDLVVGEDLFRRFPKKQEGFLSKLRAEIVCEESLAMAAFSMGLNNFLKLGIGEEQKGGRNRHSIVSDMVEAIIAAVYIDGGYEAAFLVVHTIMDEVIEKGCRGDLPGDSKSKLQERCQEKGWKLPEYHIISESGPDHDKTFVARVRIGNKVAVDGSGKTKKESEVSAAKAALEILQTIGGK